MSQTDLALKLLPLATWQTIYMVFAATFFALLLGVPLGVILTITQKGHLCPRPKIYKVLSLLVNIGRSFPFAILLIALIPFTRVVVGTSLGTVASIVPLSIAAAPFIARIVESVFHEVERALVEAAVVMGSTKAQIVMKVLFPEALPSLLRGLTTTMINLVGYSGMAGLVGGGGLGSIAIQYGYYLFNTFIMCSTVILLILIIQGIQWGGEAIVKIIYKKRRSSSNV